MTIYEISYFFHLNMTINEPFSLIHSEIFFDSDNLNKKYFKFYYFIIFIILLCQ